MLIVDRIEESRAVIEGDDGTFEVPASWLPASAREGSVLGVDVRREGDVSRVVFSLDAEGQAAREAEMRRLRDSIPEGPDGDIAL